jgi:hypothetical protein
LRSTLRTLKSASRSAAASLELPVLAEVAARGDALAVHGGQTRGHPARVAGRRGLQGLEGAGQVPVIGGGERHPLALPLHHHPGGDGLHAAGGQPGADLLPQHRGDLVAVEAVQDAPGLLGVDELQIDLAGVAHRVLDRLAGDLVEHHALGRDLRLEHLVQVPRDGLALAVLVGGEQEFVGFLEQVLELGDLLALVGVDQVERLEVAVHVHAEPAHRGALVLLGHFVGARGQVPDMADRGLDGVTRSEVALDRLRLGRRLDDDQPASRPARVR